MGRSAWFRQNRLNSGEKKEEAATLKKSWTRDVCAPEEREERMRERFRFALDDNMTKKNRFEPGTNGQGRHSATHEYNFFQRLQEPKLIGALETLAKEVTSVNRPIREVFAEFDLDGDGTLDREEMKIGMANFGVSAKMWELDAIMKAFDEDGNGKVDYEEFSEMLERHAKEQEPPPRPKSFLKRSASVLTEVFTGSKPRPPKGLSSHGSGPGMPRVPSAPGLQTLKEGNRLGTPDSGASGLARKGSKPLQVAGALQMPPQSSGGDAQPSKLLDLPPMVKQEAIKGKDDLEWLEHMMERIQRPKLRQALDKLAIQMYEARHSALTAFKEMDLNGDHMLSRDEIGTGLRKLKVSLLPSELDSIMGMFDEDMNGGVDYREFSALLARYARLISPLPPHVRADAIRTANDMFWIETVLKRIQTPKLRATLDRLSKEIYGSTRSMHSFFVQFDLNGDGVLNAQEMHAGLMKMAGPLQLAEVEAVMRAFDADGNGEIDYREFCSMLARYGRLTLPCDSEKFLSKDELSKEFPVGCRVKALFNLPKATSAEDKIGTVAGVGKKGTLLVKFKSHEPMVVRSKQVKRIDVQGDAPDIRTMKRANSGAGLTH